MTTTAQSGLEMPELKSSSAINFLSQTIDTLDNEQPNDGDHQLDAARGRDARIELMLQIREHHHRKGVGLEAAEEEGDG